MVSLIISIILVILIIFLALTGLLAAFFVKGIICASEYMLIPFIVLIIQEVIVNEKPNSVSPIFVISWAIISTLLIIGYYFLINFLYRKYQKGTKIALYIIISFSFAAFFSFAISFFSMGRVSEIPFAPIMWINTIIHYAISGGIGYFLWKRRIDAYEMKHFPPYIPEYETKDDFNEKINIENFNVNILVVEENKNNKER